MARTLSNFRLRWTFAVVALLICAGYIAFTHPMNPAAFREAQTLFAISALMLFAGLWALVGRAWRPAAILLGTAAVFTGVPLTITWLGYLVSDLGFWFLNPRQDRPEAILVTCLVVTGIGLVLFYIRLKLRFLYGATEVGAGLAVSAYKTFTEPVNFSALSIGWPLAILTAGIYLVVRGFDNMHQGLTKEPDAALIWISQWLPWTVRGETRLVFSAIEARFRKRRVVRTRMSKRLGLAFDDPARAAKRRDYLGREITKRSLTTFAVLDGDTLAFRLDVERRDAALALTDATLWTPPRASQPNERWVSVPYEHREHWHTFANDALMAAIIESTAAPVAPASSQSTVETRAT